MKALKNQLLQGFRRSESRQLPSRLLMCELSSLLSNRWALLIVRLYKGNGTRDLVLSTAWKWLCQL